jgi:threonyl-tRNA synthetase
MFSPNDHRVLGPKLGLFHQQEEAPGSVFWHPNGYVLWRLVENYIRGILDENNYVEVKSPQLVGRSLWEQSGHWEKFQDSMFVVEAEKRHFALKPMNCPCHIQIFKQGIKSYRDLPVRMAEFGSCHRAEPSGSLHGIMRVRGFVQDDAHIFCRPDQVQSEVSDFIKLLQRAYSRFGFEKVSVRLSDRPEKRIGGSELWDKAEADLAEALKQNGLAYEVGKGEGAFYGPKIEFSVEDSMGRSWQLGTIQLDFNLPQRLGAEYIGEDGQPHVPVMLHRAILGSMERFLGILIEHHAGKFPLWLAPVQVEVLPISDKQNWYAEWVVKNLKARGYRARAVLDSERIGAKIAASQDRQVPFMFVVGKKEAGDGSVSVRHRDKGDLGSMLPHDFDAVAGL